jgi:hypothetical protein
MIRVNGDEPPDTVCTPVLNVITSHRSTVSSTGRARRHVQPVRLRPQNGIIALR